MRAVLLSVFLLAAGSPALASPFVVKEAQVCLAVGPAPPDFSGPDCTMVGVNEIDPQGRLLWVRAVVNLPQGAVQAGRPLGLFVSASASTEARLNGFVLGANGTPGASRAAERPGRMDVVFAVPREALVAGANEVVLLMSAQHAPIRLRHPVHAVQIGVFADPTDLRLRHYWPSLLTFGAFAAGALYFAGAAAAGGMRRTHVLLSLASVFAAAQLLAEAWRGLAPYAYPDHGIRLSLIVACSFGFSLCLAAHVVATYAGRARIALIVAIAAATAIAIAATPGFDSKAGAAIFIPPLAAFLIALRAALKKAPQAGAHAAALGAFLISILLFPTQFLDTLFFWEVAALLFVLFLLGAIATERDRRALEIERARSLQLEAALERAAASDEAVIKVAGAGSIALVRAAQIAFCQAAGDYAELHLGDGRKLLHHASLTQLEQDLPAAFLRVHRSFIVNTDFIVSLRRDASGVGALTLSTGAEVPVSRRIMPTVRNSLARS